MKNQSNPILLIGFAFVVLSIGWYFVKQNQLKPTREEGVMSLEEFRKVRYTGEKWNLTNAEWSKRLTEEQYSILREGGTERAFSGKYNDWKEEGTFVCGACKLPLFSSKEKYNSGTGWPSFWQPLYPENISYKDDHSLFMTRIEVLCSRCSSHLGHVFEDGPPPTYLRYCINSPALDFEK